MRKYGTGVVHLQATREVSLHSSYERIFLGNLLIAAIRIYFDWFVPDVPACPAVTNLNMEPDLAKITSKRNFRMSFLAHAHPAISAFVIAHTPNLVTSQNIKASYLFFLSSISRQTSQLWNDRQVQSKLRGLFHRFLYVYILKNAPSVRHHCIHEPEKKAACPATECGARQCERYVYDSQCRRHPLKSYIRQKFQKLNERVCRVHVRLLQSSAQ